jgi:UDP-N-acetylglucosamine 2-epimerase (non-hydrolysing)
VDEPGTLREILAALEEMAGMLPVVFPVHPRTRQRMASLHAAPQGGRVRLLDPVGYLDCLALMREAAMVVTDSGGVQEETTFLGVPCLTVRPNTERPVTIDVGTNRLVEASRAAIVDAARESLSAGPRQARVPEFWDGRAAQRIVEVMLCR